MSIMLFFFFSSRRRHTRCALVTGVQTCALPILGCGMVQAAELSQQVLGLSAQNVARVRDLVDAIGCPTTAPDLGAEHWLEHMRVDKKTQGRSEERRVGEECVRTCRSRWSQYH